MSEVNRKNEILLTQMELKEILHYDPETGNFTWLKLKPHAKISIGDIAGNFYNGYIRIKINNIRYLSHRLAWLYMTGSWPKFDIDHIEGIDMPNFNKFSNLRDTNKNEWNPQKLMKHNTSGFRGIVFRKASNDWIAQIGVNYKRIYLGCFSTSEEASLAYETAKEKYHII
jgi:hypothetical protein